jgi:hypothetical protein
MTALEHQEAVARFQVYQRARSAVQEDVVLDVAAA